VIFGFFDESGFSDRPHVVRTWGLKGQTPLIQSAGGWKRLTAAGMVVLNAKTKRTSALFWLLQKGMHKEKMLSILNDLKKKYRRRRFTLLWDSLPVHKAKIVTRFVEENSSWLTDVRFPCYAPELNPQEYGWSGMKRKDFGNYCAPSIQSLKGKVRRVLKKRASERAFLRGCIKASGLLNAGELGEG
jgi:putative transposase